MDIELIVNLTSSLFTATATIAIAWIGWQQRNISKQQTEILDRQVLMQALMSYKDIQIEAMENIQKGIDEAEKQGDKEAVKKGENILKAMLIDFSKKMLSITEGMPSEDKTETFSQIKNMLDMCQPSKQKVQS